MADVEDSTAKQDVWGAHLDAWKASGLSMRGYCLKEGIGLNGLRYWRDKVGESESRHKVVKLPVKLGLAEPMIEVVSWAAGSRFACRKASRPRSSRRLSKSWRGCGDHRLGAREHLRASGLDRYAQANQRPIGDGGGGACLRSVQREPFSFLQPPAESPQDPVLGQKRILAGVEPASFILHLLLFFTRTLISSVF